MQVSKWLRVSILAFAVAMVLPASAQAQWDAEKKFLGAHVGLSAYGSAAALGVNGEFPYNERIGIGGFVDTWSYGQNFIGSSWTVRYIAFAATGAYHFPIESNPKLDPFLGVALGYHVVSTSIDTGIGNYSGSAGSTMLLGGFAGGRYFFSETLSGVARLGFGATYLTVGLDWGF